MTHTSIVINWLLAGPTLVGLAAAAAGSGGGAGDVFFGVGTLILAYRKPSIVAQLPKLQGGQISIRFFAFYK